MLHIKLKEKMYRLTQKHKLRPWKVRHWNGTDKFVFFLLNWKLVDRLLTMICMIPKVNLGVGEMGFILFSKITLCQAHKFDKFALFDF